MTIPTALNGFKLFSLMILMVSCTTLKQTVLKTELKKVPEKSPVLSKYFVGFSLYDPDEAKFLLNLNAEKYFTPASNTKLLTLATWLSTGLDSIPGFMYHKKQNNLYIRPFGDPTFLHPDFPIQTAFDFLNEEDYDTLFIINSKSNVDQYGPGWAWDDYTYDFQPERSLLPLYGNVLTVYERNGVKKYIPEFFKPFVIEGAPGSRRAQDYNLFEIPGNGVWSSTQSLQIPLRMTNELMTTLLQDTLYRPVKLIPYQEISPANEKVFYSYDRLPVLARMMLISDNFLAEQLLLNAQLFESFQSTSGYILSKKNTLFKDAPQPLEWVDGSGLSRYNMFTPNSMVKVVETIYQQLSWKEISLIFPRGGVSGTLRNWYQDEEPYIYAKTGTLRHNHCLSGFILTQSGKRLIFSFMNNHYTTESSEVKKEMERILRSIRDAY